MRTGLWYVTGTDTGVGKTVLSALLTAHCRQAGIPVAALKPLCSGDRADAKALREAAGKVLTLDEVNPWHFRAPVAPLIAARRAGRFVTLQNVTAYIQTMHERFPMLIIEGAGGLLSPMGEGFDSRELIHAVGAIPFVVCDNRLGAINRVRLAIEALPPRARREARVVLMSASHADSSAPGNPALLRELLGRDCVTVLPRLRFPRDPNRALANRRVRALVERLTGVPFSNPRA